LVWARTYIDSLTLGIRPDSRAAVIRWLRTVFDPRFDEATPSIILEGLSNTPRILPIYFEETDESPREPRFEPRFAPPSVLWRQTPVARPKQFPEDYPPVVAFHSFKGGVGRTLHAIAFAHSLAAPSNGSPNVLLVDADLEAPGITWFLESRFPIRNVSLSDFIALAHADPNPDLSTTLALVADRVRTMRVDNMYVLPAFRTMDQFNSLAISPEHLIQGSDPFIFSQMLAALGKHLGVSAVIVDLRAGLSEVSSGILLDPRVYRVFVTTLSSQSIKGTLSLLDVLGKVIVEPSTRAAEPVPSVILTQIPPELVNGDAHQQAEQALLEVMTPFYEMENDTEALNLQVTPILLATQFDSQFAVLPNSWDDLLERLSRAEITRRVRTLSDWIPQRGKPKVHPEVVSAAGVPQKARERLRDFANRLVFAEASDDNDFLVTDALLNLASDFADTVPNVVVVGSKGAGKTFTFLQIVRREYWERYVQSVLPSAQENVTSRTNICPVLYSESLLDKPSRLVERVRQETAQTLHQGQPINAVELSTALQRRTNDRPGDSEGWLDVWLDAIAWSVGLEVYQESAGRHLLTVLKERGQRIVAVFDGLENVFSELSTNHDQQKALKALLVDVPNWLRLQPDRSVGLLVFVRQDMVSSVIAQNAAQFLKRHEAYALKWNREEALRLAYWTAQKANLEFAPREKDPSDMGREQLESELIPLWGRKLGVDSSKEGTSHIWVIAALSDFNGQIQARDIIRFLYEAANLSLSQSSLSDSRWADRILVPQAIRFAVNICSTQKIEETKVENLRLRDIFSALESVSSEEKKIPFTIEQARKIRLSPDDLQQLEENGVVFKDRENYYIPEIYRQGLGFELEQGARPKVIALQRQAQRRSR
jgi:MinD-like ATPase involved in chromosome partitioning or flagellar assembly